MLDVAIQKAVASEMVKIQVSKQTNGSMNTDEVYTIHGSRGRGRRGGTHGRPQASCDAHVGVRPKQEYSHGGARPKQSSFTEKCHYCGKTAHNRARCPARDSQCRKCG